MSGARTMPMQRPGRSTQEVGTPRVFLDAVQARFGRIVVDLAADASNHIGPHWCGPGGMFADALSLACQWNWTAFEGLRWLNPPYSEIGKWADKCAEQSAIGPCRIALLVPASVGTNWFAKYVDGKALVLFLRPRLTFVNHRDPYPKDLMLCLYGENPRYECWRWR